MEDGSGRGMKEAMGEGWKPNRKKWFSGVKAKVKEEVIY